MDLRALISLILKARFSLILGTPFSILWSQIGSLKRLEKNPGLLLQNLKTKQIHKEIHLFYNLFKVREA